MDIVVREMMPIDYARKGYIHYQSWQEAYTGIMDQQLLTNQTLEKCQSIARRWPQNTLVALADGEVVGFGCYIRHEDGRGEISAIYILKGYHGNGIGKKLMSALMEQLSDCSPVFLWVLQGNDHAIGFYQHFGFSFDGNTAVLPRSTNVELRMTYCGS